MTTLGRIMKDAKARDIAARKARAVTWVERRFVLRVPTEKAFGVETGETEEVVDQRDGRQVTRPKLAFLPRSQVRLVEGRLEPGAEVLLEVPTWLLEKNGLG